MTTLLIATMSHPRLRMVLRVNAQLQGFAESGLNFLCDRHSSSFLKDG